jgi:competence protein ComEC
VRLRQPHGAANPHGFDVEGWLWEQQVGATGYVRAAVGAGPAKAAARIEAGAAHPVARLRHALRDAIFATLGERPAAGVVAALAIGDQASIERDGWDLYRATGVAHLLSVSGLHVTMFAWLVGLIVGAAWRRSPRAMRAWPAPTAALVGGFVAALAYAVLAGFGVPAQRTIGMLGVVVACRLLGLAWPVGLVLLAAATAVCAADPWAMRQPGFWLSFVAVAMLVASEPVQPRRGAAVVRGVLTEPALPAGWRALRASPAAWGGAAWALAGPALRTQAVATVGLAPLTLVFFQQVSVVGFAANLVAIPLVTLLVTPLAVAGLVLPGAWWLAALAIEALDAFLAWLAAWPLATWHAAAAPAWAVVLGLAGGVLAVLPLPWRLRCCALPMLLPLAAPPLERPPPGRFELVALDVGQGTAVIVRTARHLALVDTGPRWGEEADAGSRLVVPLLRARGERRVDALVLSHRDSDHTGGAAAVLHALPVVRLVSSLEAGHPLLAGRAGGGHAGGGGAPPALQRCESGQRWHWDGVEFELLHPPAADHAREPPLKPNALSCVLRVRGANGTALLAGDIEAAQEAALLTRAAAAAGGPGALRADLLVVPHHGSRTSSTAAFLEAVAPRVAVVQAGYRSRFGHPAPEVLARYAARGVPVMRTDHCGAFTWRADGRMSCWRAEHRRAWHWRGTGSAAPPPFEQGAQIAARPREP